MVVRSMRDCIKTKSLATGALRVRNFHSTCNFDIVRLNNEVLLPTEQLQNFNHPDDKEFHFWQEIVKFYKFKPHLNFSYQILLPHKTKAVTSFAKSILKR